MPISAIVAHRSDGSVSEAVCASSWTASSQFQPAIILFIIKIH